MENTTTNKVKTAEEILDNTIKSYNSQASDLHKFAFNKSEKELFCNMMNLFASLQTEAKDRELSSKQNELNETSAELQQAIWQRDEWQKINAGLESSLSLSKKENEELKNKNRLQDVRINELETLFDDASDSMEFYMTETKKALTELTSVKEQLTIQSALNTSLNSQLTASRNRELLTQEANTKLVEALEKIANWELPKTGEFWDGRNTRPVSFETNYGSNGARDYIKNLALSALSFKADTNKTKDK